MTLLLEQHFHEARQVDLYSTFHTQGKFNMANMNKTTLNTAQ